MNKIITVISLALMGGAPIVICSLTLFDGGHSIWLALIGVASAFIGTTLSYGFSGFYEHPKFIGNIDNSIRPVINQNWIMLIITIGINLMVANLAGTW